MTQGGQAEDRVGTWNQMKPSYRMSFLPSACPQSFGTSCKYGSNAGRDVPQRDVPPKDVWEQLDRAKGECGDAAAAADGLPVLTSCQTQASISSPRTRQPVTQQRTEDTSSKMNEDFIQTFRSRNI